MFKNIYTVAKRELSYNIRKPSFLFSAFGTPILLVVIFAVVMFLSLSTSGDLATFGTVGYVDTTGEVLSQGVQPEEYPDLFSAYASTDAAQAALEAGEIAAFIELPSNYMLNGRVNLYTNQDTPSDLEDVIEEFLLLNLTHDLELPLPLERINDGGDGVLVRSAKSGRAQSLGGVFFMLFFPIIFAMMLIVSTTTTSGFLMQGLIEERTNRIVEILVTSVTPFQLLLGKVLGLALLGLLQVCILLVMVVIGLSVAGSLELVQGITLPFDMILMSLIYFLLTYFLTSALFTMLSVIANTDQESRQYSSLIVLPFMIPYFFLVVFMSDPNGTLATIMSLIPFTAPMSILIRTGLTEVPTWQILASMAGMGVTIVLFVWMAARVFRWGLLLYGKRNVREILSVIFSRNPQSIASTSNRQEGVN